MNKELRKHAVLIIWLVLDYSCKYREKHTATDSLDRVTIMVMNLYSAFSIDIFKCALQASDLWVRSDISIYNSAYIYITYTSNSQFQFYAKFKPLRFSKLIA